MVKISSNIKGALKIVFDIDTLARDGSVDCVLHLAGKIVWDVKGFGLKWYNWTGYNNGMGVLVIIRQ